MRFFTIAIVILLQTVTTPAFAEYCMETGQKCIEGAETRNIQGFEVHKDCWKYEVDYSCYTDNAIDYCKTIKETSGCDLIDTKCTEQGQDGICNNLSKTYSCGNKLGEATGTILLDSQYTIIRDELMTKECEPLNQSNDCYEIEKVCVEGAETRNINGKDVHKDCWKYESKYSCFVGSHISDCEEHEKACKFISERCISQNKDKACSHFERKYLCSEVLGQKPVLMQCQGTKYCVGDNCEETHYKPNQNMGKAISALSAIRNLKDDIDLGSCKSGDSKACKVFNGQDKTCRINPWGARNCCKDNGWLQDFKLASCKESEKLLADSKSKGLCREIGIYCSEELDLGVVKQCIEHKRSYCCFQSRLARIIQEQGRAQLGIGWGSPESPNCIPLTVEQLQKIDFSKINFSEFYSEAMAKMNGAKQNYTPIFNTEAKTASVKQAVQEEARKSEQTFEYQNEIARRISRHYDK